VHVVAKAMGLDGRISRKFLHPGPGFGGSCFPKDSRALYHLAKTHQYTPLLIKSVIDVNENQKQRMIQKIKGILGENLKGKVIGILGVSFKPNTDDIRESPALFIINKLLEENAEVRVFDPVALEEAKKAVDKSIEEKEVELAATKEEFDKVSTELNEIKTEQLVASRMDELSSEGVAREGEGREVQVAKIKEMDDEAFAAYKAELVDIKKAVASKLGSSASTDQAGLNVETETGEGSANTEELGAAFCEAFGIGSVSK